MLHCWSPCRFVADHEGRTHGRTWLVTPVTCHCEASGDPQDLYTGGREAALSMLLLKGHT
jgi:hypothetical protein